MPIGPALVLILSLTAAIIIGLYVLAFAAHCLLTVVEGTAAGNDAVTWPDEPLTDWMTRAFSLGVLLSIWLAPSAILSRALRNDWLEYDHALRFFLLAVPGVWLFFPIGLLSSLSASSRWFFFRSSIVGVLLRLLPSTLIFYVLTAVIAVGMAVVWYFAVCRQMFALILVAAPLGAAGLLIYARLLGRLSERIQRLNPPKEERAERPKIKKKRRVEEREEEAWEGEAPAEPRAEARQEPRPPKRKEETRPEPRASVPADPALDVPVPLVSEAEAAAAAAEGEFPLKPMERDEEYDNRWAKQLDDGPADPYDLSGEPDATPPEYRRLEEYDSDEMGPQVSAEQRTGVRPRLKRKRPAPDVRAPSWWRGVYLFPFYATTIGAWIWLTVGFMVFGLCCGLVVTNYPRGE